MVCIHMSVNTIERDVPGLVVGRRLGNLGCVIRIMRRDEVCQNPFQLIGIRISMTIIKRVVLGAFVGMMVGNLECVIGIVHRDEFL